LTEGHRRFKQLIAMARVLLKQVAARAGVHLSTVSLALRDDPRLPEATRKKIQSLAAEMGYVPDAAMRALCAYRSSVRPKEVQSGLAYLIDHAPKPDSLSAIVYQGAKAQAARLGYNLITFNLAEKGATIERFQSIWRNSGLRGVLVGPFRNVGITLGGDWDQWITVVYGYSVEAPLFHRAVFDHFQNMLVHLQVLRSKGYKRIGLSLAQRTSDSTHGMLHGAYLLDQARHGPKKSIPILTQRTRDADELEQWVQKERLDALISYVEEYSILVERGWKIPEQLGFSLLSTWAQDQRGKSASFAGFDTKAEILASNAVSFLVSLIHEQAYGISDTPRSTMVTGTFREGKTVRA
jgi:LacI family transcriptional regulator